MKRIDLHIHTLPSPLDGDFSFDPDVLKTHVERNGLSAIAVTNHDLFNTSNYRDVCAAVPDDICVLPGIEVSVKGFHVLVIANPANIDQFSQICSDIKPVQQGEDGMSLEVFRDHFSDGGYIIIPHYKKKPLIPADDLIALNDVITALEVTSEKKWEYEHSRVDKPVVMFSDYRCATGARPSLGKYTYITIGEITYDSLRLAFNDSAKFAITERVDHMELGPGLFASMGLNVVVGSRSSGKTFFLDRIYDSCDPDDVVYVRQFGIVKDAEESAFRAKLDGEESAIKSDYYEPMTAVSTAAEELPSREAIVKSIKDYLIGLAEYAETSARDDEFSKCPIYSEGRLAQDNVAAEKKVVEALVTLLDDNPLSLEIETILGRDALLDLLRMAIERFKAKALKCKRIDLANSIAKTVRESLTVE